MRISDWSSDVCSADLEPTYSPSSPASSPSTCPESPAVRGRPASRTPTNLRPKPAENPEEGPQVHLTAPTCGPNPRKTAKKGRRFTSPHHPAPKTTGNTPRNAAGSPNHTNQSRKEHVKTTDTNAHPVCRLHIEKTKHTNST